MTVGYVFHVITMQRIEDTFLLVHGIEIAGAAIVFKHHAVGLCSKKDSNTSSWPGVNCSGSRPKYRVFCVMTVSIV